MSETYGTLDPYGVPGWSLNLMSDSPDSPSSPDAPAAAPIAGTIRGFIKGAAAGPVVEAPLTPDSVVTDDAVSVEVTHTSAPVAASTALAPAGDANFSVAHLRQLVADTDPRPQGALITYAVVPQQGGSAFLVASCWTFLLERPQMRETLTYRSDRHGALVLEETWFTLEEVYDRLEPFLRGQGRLGSWQFSAAVQGTPIVDDLRVPTFLPNFTGWPERHVRITFETQNQGPQILHSGVTHALAPHFARGYEAAAEWVWRSTTSRGTGDGSSSPQTLLRVVLPDLRGRLGPVGALSWQASETEVAVPVETRRAAREHLQLKVEFLPARDVRPVAAPAPIHREIVPRGTVSVKITLESDSSVLDLRQLPSPAAQDEPRLYFPRRDDAETPPWPRDAGVLGPAREFGLDRRTFADELCLGVEDDADALAAVLAASTDDDVAVAVLGPWGRGKTRLANLTASKLPKWYETVHFSAWKYRRPHETWAFFYETLFRRMCEGGVRRLLRTLGRLTRSRIAKVGFWPALGALLLLAASLLPLSVLLSPLALEILSLLGIAGAWWLVRSTLVVRRSGWLKELVLPARHHDALGAQAAIGDDLRALVEGWAPEVQPDPRYWWSRSAWRERFKSIAGLGVGVVVVGGSVWYGLAGDREWLGSALLGGLIPPVHPPAWLAWTVVVLWGLVGLVPLGCAAWAGLGTNRLLVVVDDLDRLPPEQCLEVIESLRLLVHDPTIGPRVQLLALVEPDVLTRAILWRYGKEGDTITAAKAVVRDTVEKLFVAHLRLRPLTFDEVIEVVRRFTTLPAARARQLTNEVREQERDPPTQVIKDSQTSFMRTETALAHDHVRVEPAHEAMARSQAELEAAKAVLATPGPAVAPARPSSVGAPLEFTADERAALDHAFDQAVTRGDKPTFRTIQSVLFRFNLAKILLAKRGAPVTADAVSVGGRLVTAEALARALVLDELDDAPQALLSVAQDLRLDVSPSVLQSPGRAPFRAQGTIDPWNDAADTRSVLQFSGGASR